MVVDKVADKVANMVASMVVDKVAIWVADLQGFFHSIFNLNVQ